MGNLENENDDEVDIKGVFPFEQDHQVVQMVDYKGI